MSILKALINSVPVIDMVMSAAAYLSTFLKMKETKSSQDMSLLAHVLNMLILWTIYGCEYCTTFYIVECCFSIVFHIVIVCEILYFRRKNDE